MAGRYIAYYRVSTAKQAASGLGLDAQREAAAAFVAKDGGSLIAEFEEVESGKLAQRPQLDAAMARCSLTGATLLIAKLDRLSRNVHFLSGLMERGVDFIACDMPTATKFTVHIMAAVAQQEREAISLRTKAAIGTIRTRLAAGETYTSKRSGRPLKRLGNPGGLAVRRPDLGSAAIVRKADDFAAKVGPLVMELNAGGSMSLAAVAERLNAMNVATSRGKAWTPMAVKRVIERHNSTET